MAKEELTTIGLNKITIALILLVITVASAGAFWKDRGSEEGQSDAMLESVVASNVTRSTANSAGLKEIRDEQHRAELARTKLDGKVDNIMINQVEMKEDFKDFKAFLMRYDYGKLKDK
jgi:hypothetical protein